jgi:dynein heavy chain, axonemal
MLYCRYDRANTFRKMVDCQFVSAMGPPGGGRSFITPRFARHFHHVSICELDNKSMTLIFGTILGNYLKQVLIFPVRLSHVFFFTSIYTPAPVLLL